MTITFLCIMMLIIFSTSHQQQSIASNMNTPTNKNAQATSNPNPAKDARHLLDIMQQTKNIATALQEIIDVHAENLPKYVGKNLMDLSKALLVVYKEGRVQVGRVSHICNLLRSYDIATKEEREAELVRPNSVKIWIRCGG